MQIQNSVCTPIRLNSRHTLHLTCLMKLNHNTCNYLRTYVYNGTIIISQKLTQLGMRSVWVRRRHAQNLDIDVDSCQKVVL